MHNWGTDLVQLKKRSRKGAALFTLEQMINFGLAGSRISRRALVRNWRRLKLDPDRRRFLSFLLWNRIS